MTVNKETILLSLAAGVIIGLLAVVVRFMTAISGGKWFRIFLQDTTFVFLSLMLTFILSFPISNGRIRLLQVLLEMLSFSLVWLLLSPAAVYLAERYMDMRNSLMKFLRRIRQRKANKAKNRRRIAKNPKKTLDISPTGNI